MRSFTEWPWGTPRSKVARWIICFTCDTFYRRWENLNSNEFMKKRGCYGLRNAKWKMIREGDRQTQLWPEIETILLWVIFSILLIVQGKQWIVHSNEKKNTLFYKIKKKEEEKLWLERFLGSQKIKRNELKDPENPHPGLRIDAVLQILELSTTLLYSYVLLT